MITYCGFRTCGSAVVRKQIDGKSRPLALRLRQCNHSPTGFEWGYGGSGPAQLAFCMLADILHNSDEAWRLHQSFKWDVIAKLNPDKDWKMSDAAVKQWIEAHA